MSEKWSEAKYDAQRQHIQDEYVTTVHNAIAKRDQLLSQLFCECGWTQQEIADKEGRNRDWVSKRLRFGRFCDHLYSMEYRKLPVNLNERRFRELWSQHGGNVPAGSPAENKKFQAIIDSDDWQLQFASAVPFDTNGLIKERCVDNKWRSKGEIAVEIGVPDGRDDCVANAVGRIRKQFSGGLMVMDKTFSNGIVKHKFKLIKNREGQTIRAAQVVSELFPIVEDIFACLTQNQPIDAVDRMKGHLHRLKTLIAKYS